MFFYASFFFLNLFVLPVSALSKIPYGTYADQDLQKIKNNLLSSTHLAPMPPDYCRGIFTVLATTAAGRELGSRIEPTNNIRDLQLFALHLHIMTAPRDAQGYVHLNQTHSDIYRSHGFAPNAQRNMRILLTEPKKGCLQRVLRVLGHLVPWGR